MSVLFYYSHLNILKNQIHAQSTSHYRGIFIDELSKPVITLSQYGRISGHNDNQAQALLLSQPVPILTITVIIIIKESHQIRRLRWTGHVIRKQDRRGAYKVLVDKHKGRKPVGRPRRKWEENIKVNLREMGERHEMDQSGSG